MSIDRLLRNYEIEIQWTTFPLHPETPEDGLTLEELFAGRLVDIKKMMLRYKQAADEIGLPLGKREKTYNSRLAQELGKWAESKGKGYEFQQAVFRAFFVEVKNIAKIDELILLTKSAGLCDEEARRILESRAFKTAVDFDWIRAYAMGIRSVPTFVINHNVIVGAQPYGVLEQFLRTHNVKKQTDQLFKLG